MANAKTPTVDDIQDILQGFASQEEGVIGETSNCDTLEKLSNKEELRVCSAEKGCGQSFAADQDGADFRFAMLCASCYAKETDANSTISVTSPILSSSTVPVSELPPTSDDTCDDENDTPLTSVVTTDVVEMASSPKKITNVVHAMSKLCGEEMFEILQNIRSNKIDRYDVEVGGNLLAYKPVTIMQDNITTTCKKFFVLYPDPTPLLYAFFHYHALVNTRSKKGWLAHCRLTSSKPDAEGHGSMLWEIYETRCCRPRIDGVIIANDGAILLIQHLETWLIKNHLSSDVSAPFDIEFFAK